MTIVERVDLTDAEMTAALAKARRLRAEAFAAMVSAVTARATQPAAPAPA